MRTLFAYKARHYGEINIEKSKGRIRRVRFPAEGIYGWCGFGK
jgi:hypothetical protein